MKILAIHSDYVSFEPTKKAIAAAEETEIKKVHVEDCLVVFTAVESADEKNEKLAAEKLCEEITKIAVQVNSKKIVLYPYAHLSNDLSKPDTAVKVLKNAEFILKNQFEVSRSPFGWYKSFEIKCKGHPLSELSREINVTDEAKKVIHSKNEKFDVSDKELSKKDQIKLSTSLAIGLALKEIYPEAEIGSVGFLHESTYVDVSGAKIRSDDINRITKKVKDILRQDLKIGKTEDAPSGKYQEEISNDLPDAPVYNLGNINIVSQFNNPYINSTREIGVLKIINIANAYWRNNATNDQLTRIYSVGYESREELDKYLMDAKEAENRDHRKIGKDLELFSIHDEAPGMPFFHDKGTFIFNKLMEFMTFEMKKLRYEINKTPLILNKKLWLQSGHWDHYKENMYFTKIDNADYAIKPMNCPGNILVYKSKVHSYKELPIKAGEFGLVHRHELSGALSGLFRVRVFTQDDAHVFCTEEQIKESIEELIDLIGRIYSTFGFEYTVELSTKPAKAMGDTKVWEMAEKSLADALTSMGVDYKLNPGDGAFYGPKIDFHVKDTLQRSWQCGTIQLDFSMPEKFDLTYEGKDNKKLRPVMIHRAIYGSLERFFGILIEHFAGKFPLWISPVQIKIVTVTDRSLEFANKLFEEFELNGFRVEVDDRAETIGKKVHDAQAQKVNYIITVGDKEVENNSLAIRTREGKVNFGVKIEDFMAELREEIKKKEIK